MEDSTPSGTPCLCRENGCLETGESGSKSASPVSRCTDMTEKKVDNILVNNGTSPTSVLGSMGHLVWNGSGFERKKPSRVPTRVVTVRMLTEEQTKLTEVHVPDTCTVRVPAFMDTCAQTCVTDPSLLRRLGVSTSDLIPTNHKIVGVTKHPLHIQGILLVEISLGERTTNQSLYVTDSVRGLFLTMDAQMELGILPPTYPGCYDAERTDVGDGVRKVDGAGSSGSTAPVVATCSSCDQTTCWMVTSRNGSPTPAVKIGLQLYQVDIDRSYLLDFTSLAPEPEDEVSAPPAVTVTSPTTPATPTTIGGGGGEGGGPSTELLPPSRSGGKSKSPAAPNENVHNVMEFFEMCSDLIVALAC